MAVKSPYNLLKRSHALPAKLGRFTKTYTDVKAYTTFLIRSHTLLATAGAFLKDAHPIMGRTLTIKVGRFNHTQSRNTHTGTFYAHPEGR
jgi:hypothetical protein